MTLRELIRDAREAGESYSSIAARAQRRGHNLSKSDVGNFGTGTYRTFIPEKIIALADGLDMPLYRVAVAFLAEHGIDLPLDVRTPEDAIRADPTLSQRTRQTLLVILDGERRPLGRDS
ncbi:MAG TPA: hypothetical protein VFH56_08305 [Acidimicrobiales bacterium]|nr:hypothetical protein [Acidimicrobiales bacterium]